MKQLCILLALVSFSGHIHAQFSLRGSVTGTNDESLAGAYVTIRNTYYQTVTDEYGIFEIKGLKTGTYQLSISYLGYEPYENSIFIQAATEIQIHLKESATMTDAVIVSAVRAGRQTPTTYTTISREEIDRMNLAQDLPFLLSHETSVVATSDGGAGVGYTALRIRGSDMTRINVTINGVPLNDPESHTVYWVDIPDFASSINSLQLQRGVGTSTNGAGAFGASMNIETNAIRTKPFGHVNLAAGSFNTWKTSFQAGTGLINDHWYFEGRGSLLGSDGYIDRASSELGSFFIQGGYAGNKTLIKAIAFGGKEKTYQAWYGIDEYTMKKDRTFNWAGVINNDDGSVSYYDNQTDNYTQNHFQLHLSQRLSGKLNLNLAGHYTLGNGYYEEYMEDQKFASYGLDSMYIDRDSTDLIRRRWLDNQYYGVTWSLQYQGKKTELTLGGALNKYDKARHFGEIIWAEHAWGIPYHYEYYNNTSFKTDFNVFVKASWSPIEKLSLYGDIQYRKINYHGKGIESHLENVYINEDFLFFNPKLGISYQTGLGDLYASYSIAHREPIRDDFTDANEGEKPKPETLGDFEAGIRKSSAGFRYSINYYLMNYRNQLVLTGAINDDGQYIRKNSGKSYRTGVEVAGSYQPARLIEVGGNLTVSSNKTDYKQNEEGQIREYEHVTISFSPSLTAGAQMRLFPVRNLEADWFFKFVGKQYLDNTGNDALSLDPYFTNDLKLSWMIHPAKVPVLEFTFMIYNLLNAQYESNGAVYEGYACYFPQAGIHFLAGLHMRF